MNRTSVAFTAPAIFLLLLSGAVTWAAPAADGPEPAETDGRGEFVEEQPVPAAGAAERLVVEFLASEAWWRAREDGLAVHDPGDEAQETGPPGTILSLREAIDIALERNHRLAAEGGRLRTADAGVDEARSVRFPRVDVWETFQRTTNPVFVFSNLLGQEAFGPENFAVDRLNQPDALNNWQTRLGVSMPIWAGGRIGEGIAAARLARDAVGAQVERTRQEVIHQVVEAYTGALLADRHFQVARQARKTARAHVDLVGDLFEGGLVVESDLLQARVRLSEVEEMVIRAESAVEISRAALNLSMGRDLDTPVDLPDDFPADVAGAAADPVAGSGGRDRGPGNEGPGTADDLESLIREARQKRPDLIAARRRSDAARRHVEIARTGYFPEIGIAGFYEANAEEFIGGDGTNWSLMVSARFTPFDGFATPARVAAAEGRRSRAESMTRLLEQSVALEVRQARADVEVARQRLEQARAAVEMARESLRIVEDRYREGLTTVVELLDAQTSLTRARTREVGARRDLRLARASLDLAVGRL